MVQRIKQQCFILIYKIYKYFQNLIIRLLLACIMVRTVANEVSDVPTRKKTYFM